MARYDGQTEWYDSFASAEPFTELRRAAVRLLGHGTGRCLDLGCGTGRTIPFLEEAGWQVVGVDVSADQLALARAVTAAELLEADAHELPFADGSFDAAVSLLTHTDLDDVSRAFAEVARVLAPGGAFVFAGVHPCFASPFVQPLDDGTSLLHPGYREEGWHTVSRDPDNPGIRSRVGFHHVMLATFLNALVDAGLSPVSFAEPGERDPPLFFAFRAEKRRAPTRSTPPRDGPSAG